jgi:predicted nucleotidyltransferase
VRQQNYQFPLDAIAAFCQKWRIVEFALFGSVLRDDFGPDSDIDALVRFAPDTHYSLFTYAGMENELSDLLGRSVDLIDRAGLEHSSNARLRQEILDTVEVLYAA